MPGLVRGVARTAVVAGTASAVGGRVHHRQQQKWADQDAQQAQAQYAEQQQMYAQQAPPPAPAPAAAGEGDTLTQLKQLGELKDAGVLTEAEFEAQKAKILAG
jgi:hemolysin activation/secretion protein